MKKVMCLVVAVFSVFVYGFAFAGSTNPTVTVVNTSSNPVPVTGNVGITGTPSVNVVNTEVNPITVKKTDEPGRVPYEVSLQFAMVGERNCHIWQEGNSSIDCPNKGFMGGVLLFGLPPVPADKILIIKRISGQLPAVDVVGASVALQRTPIFGIAQIKWLFAGPFFLMTPVDSSDSSDRSYGFDSGDLFVTHGPGETPHINIHAPVINGITSGLVCSMVISGYLIEAN